MCPRLTCGLLLISCLMGARGDRAVYLRSKYGQPVTSTCLRWVPQSMGEIPTYAVLGSTQILESDEASTIETEKSRPVFVCRVMDDGLWIPGGLKTHEKVCRVSTLQGEVKEYSKYEVLENIEASSRLAWVAWNKFSGVAPGAVMGGKDLLVARRPYRDNGSEPGPTHFMGTLDTTEGLGKISLLNQDDQSELHTDGEILVETEPKLYDLTVTEFNYKRQRAARQPRILGAAVLRNDNDNSEYLVESVITYDAKYSLNWGQGQGILKGLPTTIRFPNATVFENIRWGLTDSEDRNESAFKVEYLLAPQTAVNVTLHGNHTVTDIPYTGKLVAVYEDDGTRSRQIELSRREVAMIVYPVYGPVYFLNNQTLVPTTTTTTTTTSTTTTTTTTSTPPPPTQESTKALEELNKLPDAGAELDNDLEKKDAPAVLQNDQSLHSQPKDAYQGAGQSAGVSTAASVAAAALLLLLLRIC